ncbi:hypothetical protein Ssi03_48560 [Sphaerisporangium siamense]|uniref:Anti-anti-sigma regulatory factor n=1 Tax=Sphaerisporangium siamense TaxID=795645 RepID=A0A7W7D532_9ACTN|nr:hypothetical protein [Sphaerisporangium siamense]MBB4699455.1 anti-anti-sigma regulatory factor [Sphaerisporangium siamense]GII86866.1 hypothetical protein Ssi03_48560 [Sphaerisporangium siamense]
MYPPSPPHDPDPGTPRELLVTSMVVSSRFVVIGLRGHLGPSTYRALKERLAWALTLMLPPRIIVDVSELASARAEGVTVLRNGADHARAAGGLLLVCGATDVLGPAHAEEGGPLDVRSSMGEAIREIALHGGDQGSGQPRG